MQNARSNFTAFIVRSRLIDHLCFEKHYGVEKK